MSYTPQLRAILPVVLSIRSIVRAQFGHSVDSSEGELVEVKDDN